MVSLPDTSEVIGVTGEKIAELDFARAGGRNCP